MNGKGITDKIEGVKSLALLAKKRKKKKMAQRMMDALEYCKQHGGPVTAKDTEKLKSFTETEIIAEVGFFLKRTTT